MDLSDRLKAISDFRERGVCDRPERDDLDKVKTQCASFSLRIQDESR